MMRRFMVSCRVGDKNESELAASNFKPHKVRLKCFLASAYELHDEWLNSSLNLSETIMNFTA